MCETEIASDSQWTQSINSFHTICWHLINRHIWDVSDDIRNQKLLRLCYYSSTYQTKQQSFNYFYSPPPECGLTARLPRKCDWFCKNITSNVSCELLLSVQVNNSILLVTVIAQLLLTMPCMAHTSPFTLTSAKVHICMYSWWLTY